MYGYFPVNSRFPVLFFSQLLLINHCGVRKITVIFYSVRKKKKSSLPNGHNSFESTCRDFSFWLHNVTNCYKNIIIVIIFISETLTEMYTASQSPSYNSELFKLLFEINLLKVSRHLSATNLSFYSM